MEKGVRGLEKIEKMSFKEKCKLLYSTDKKTAVFLVIGIVLIISALALWTSPRYKSCKDFIDVSIEEYKNSMALFTESQEDEMSKYYGDAYKDIAGEYLRMAEEISEKLLHYRIAIGSLSALGVICLMIGGIRLKRSRAVSTDVLIRSADDEIEVLTGTKTD